MTDSLVLDGKKFDLTLRADQCNGGAGAWQWILASPGELVLSGEAPSADEARRFARCAASLWAAADPLL